MKSSDFTVVERDESGRRQLATFLPNSKAVELKTLDYIDTNNYQSARRLHALAELARKVFLPAGFPQSVSPDYVRYQVFNAAQAFCSSLAGLLASRAMLEGYGVGKADATASHALLLTVVQDAVSRLGTIIGGYYTGPSLYSEAKTYRFLADVVNDGSIIIDTLSPIFASYSKIPGIMIAALCASGILRSMCGVFACGSKAAISMHFATPLEGKGDISDLSAKDGSKETVLALVGMLVGTITLQYLTEPFWTYVLLFTLVSLHLLINFFGVRGLTMRTINRQRANLAWIRYRNSASLSPSSIASSEVIFSYPNILRNQRNEPVTSCYIGTSLGGLAHQTANSLTRFFEIYREQKFLVIPDRNSSSIHIVLKDGYDNHDVLRAWCYASELTLASLGNERRWSLLTDWGHIEKSQKTAELEFEKFMELLRRERWAVEDPKILAGSPEAVLVSGENRVNIANGFGKEDKKDI